MMVGFFFFKKWEYYLHLVADVLVEWGESDTELIEPLQQLLNQCKSAKLISKLVLANSNFIY